MILFPIVAKPLNDLKRFEAVKSYYPMLSSQINSSRLRALQNATSTLAKRGKSMLLKLRKKEEGLNSAMKWFEGD